jgi:uncharacterized membrane-anchored protein YjiN (DUF445 family)
MSKFLKSFEGNKTLTSTDIDRIAEELHNPKPEVKKVEKAKPSISEKKQVTVTQKAMAKSIMVEPVNDYETIKLHRLTLDIPEDLFEEMKRDTKKRGKTIKAFLVTLIETYYGRV